MLLSNNVLGARVELIDAKHDWSEFNVIGGVKRAQDYHLTRQSTASQKEHFVVRPLATGSAWIVV